MYKPFRAALEALRREFDRAAVKYPGLYYEMLEIDDSHLGWAGNDDNFHLEGDVDKPTVVWHESIPVEARGKVGYVQDDGRFNYTPLDMQRMIYMPEKCLGTMWRAFIAGHKKESWEERDLSPDGNACGRVFAAKDGLTEFKKLGESLELVLNEIEPEQRKRTTYQECLYELFLMAYKYPTSLLRLRYRTWDYAPGEAPKPKVAWIDEPPSDDWHLEDNEIYPLHPYCECLVHNVFVSAVAAIDAILEPECSLLIGRHRSPQHSRFARIMRELAQAEVDAAEEELEDSEADDVVSTSAVVQADSGNVVVQAEETPSYIFKREDNIWHMKFTDRLGFEEDRFTHSENFEVIRRLLLNEDREMDALELFRPGLDLDRISGGEQRSGVETLVVEKTGVDSDRKKVRQRRLPPEERKQEEAALAAAVKVIEDVEEEIKLAKENHLDIRVIEDLEAKRKEYKSVRAEIIDRLRGFPPISSPSEMETARSGASVARSRGIQLIAKKMPRFAMYLRKNLERVPLQAKWVYRPLELIHWVLS
jgi:hypothetical protein